MSDPSPSGRTFNIGLKFSAHETENFNWNKLDDTIGNAFTPDSILQIPPGVGLPPITIPADIGKVVTVDPSGIAAWRLPAGSLVGIGTPVLPGSGQYRVTRTPSAPVEVCALTMPSTEDQVRWEVVIGQVTMEVDVAANSGVLPQLDLRRGAPGSLTVAQSRAFTYSCGTGQSVPIMDVPLTVVLVGVPSDLSHRWSLGWSSIGGSGTSGLAWADILFAQLYAIQFP